MDEKIIKVVASKLRKLEGQPINAEKLSDIREAIFKSTGTNKSASFSNVKKWVKAARSYIKNVDKQQAKSACAVASKPQSKPSRASAEQERPHREPVIPAVSRKVEDSVNMIKEEAIEPAPVVEVSMQRPTVVFDKVYLQSIKFEVASIRQTMERVSRQLDKLEKELTSHRSDD